MFKWKSLFSWLAWGVGWRVRGVGLARGFLHLFDKPRMTEGVLCSVLQEWRRQKREKDSLRCSEGG